MPRKARIKTLDSMFHIMLHSISELDLFRDSSDKDMYLYLIEKAKIKYSFKVYAFCLMDTHAHILIDCFSADISKIMHYINLCYSIYYNKKYTRRGPVFQDRFKSKLVDSYNYFINLSLYIHSNPKDLVSIDQEILSYPYNSLIDYIHGSNRFNILDSALLTTSLGLNNPANQSAYLRLIDKSLDISISENIEQLMNKYEYRDEKMIFPRFSSPAFIVSYTSHYFNVSSLGIHIKHHPQYTRFRALTCFFLNTFNNMSHKSICKFIGNISMSRVSSLINQGLTLILQNPCILQDFIRLNNYV